MMGTHHNPPMTVHITKGELRQALITKIAPKIVKRGIKNISMLHFDYKYVVNYEKIHGVENYVVFVVWHNCGC